jgi:peptidyl-prolyl cis-trans isomerase D
MMGAQFDQKLFETPEAKQAVLDQPGGRTRRQRRSRAQPPDRQRRRDVQKAIRISRPSARPTAASTWTSLQGRAGRPGHDPGNVRPAHAPRHGRCSSWPARSPPRSRRAVANRLSDINDQQREVQELVFPAAPTPQVKVTDEMVKAFYDKNAACSRCRKGQGRVRRVRRRHAVEKQVSVSDAEVATPTTRTRRASRRRKAQRQPHPDHRRQGRQAGRRRRRQGQGRSGAGRSAQEPGDFAKIAKAQSQDPGSAELGGDLGVVEKGVFVKPVEDAIYKLKEGEISGWCVGIRLPHHQGHQGQAGGPEVAGRSQGRNRRRTEEDQSCRRSIRNWPRPSRTPSTSSRTA